MSSPSFYRREANRYRLRAAVADRQQAEQYRRKAAECDDLADDLDGLRPIEPPAALAPINQRHIAWPLLRGGLR
jgi:hypothetical protein